MLELFAGLAVVVSLTAIVGVLVLAREVGLMREHRLRTSAANARALPHEIVGYRTLAGSTGILPSVEPHVVLFTLASCAPCERLLTGLGTGDARLRAATILVAKSTEFDATAMGERSGLPLAQIVADEHGAIAARYSVTGFPTAMAVSREQVHAIRPVASIDDLVNLAKVASAPSQNLEAYPDTHPAHARHISGSVSTESRQ
jgi:hypothetical protein